MASSRDVASARDVASSRDFLTSSRDCGSRRDSTRSLRNLVQICEETEKIGIATVNNLNQQGNALDRTKTDLQTISVSIEATEGGGGQDSCHRKYHTF